jgi:biopolymer transport protein TolQ
MSILGLLLEASLPVQIVILLLAMASIVSWSIIFTKRRLIRRTTDASDDFEANFWSGGDLNTLYSSTTRDRAGNVGMASIFESGFREFNRAMQAGGINADKVVEECRRAMRVAQMREVDRVEQSLATLATIGSTSPYVGLFGTVWGIMTAFMNLGNVQTATLAVVAPPIAEALIATAMGLFAAIPAVIAYNRYADKVVRLEYRYDGFTEEPLQKRKLMGEINVVPYIDVMLVLLVIFMVTAPLLTQGIEVELPKAGAEPIDSAADKLPLIVSVDKAGNLYLSVGDDEDEPSNAKEIVAKVGAILRNSPETPMLIKADRAVEYGYVVGAMVLLQQGGAENVGFVTDPLDTYPVPE